MVPPYSMRRKLRRFFRIGARKQGLLLEASLLLAVSRLALLLVPFPVLARRMGEFVKPAEAGTRAALFGSAPDQARIADEIGWAVTRAARYAPFKAVCLPQAMAARMMLARRGVKSVLHFGVMKETGKPLNAHAWLDAAGVEVTGYAVAREFAEIACFV